MSVNWHSFCLRHTFALNSACAFQYISQVHVKVSIYRVFLYYSIAIRIYRTDMLWVTVNKHVSIKKKRLPVLKCENVITVLCGDRAHVSWCVALPCGSMPSGYWFIVKSCHQIFNTRRSLVGNKLTDHSDVVVAAPSTFSLSTWDLASMLQFIRQRQL